MNSEVPSSEIVKPGEPPTTVEIASRGAPGAIPLTGGVPPEDASGAPAPAPERDPTEDLVDAFDLMLRAMRRLSGTADPQLEALAARVLAGLQQLEGADSVEQDARPEKLALLCSEAARELGTVIGAVASRTERVLARQEPGEAKR